MNLVLFDDYRPGMLRGDTVVDVFDQAAVGCVGRVMTWKKDER